MSPKRSKSLIYELTFSIIAQMTDKIQRNYIFAYVSIWVHIKVDSAKHSPFDYLQISILLLESDTNAIKLECFTIWFQHLS